MRSLDVSKYRSMFVNRDDVFAVQQPDGRYFPAGEGHWEGDSNNRKFVYDSYTKLTDDVLQEHLDGAPGCSYGVYVIDPMCDNSVKYMVFDLDTYEPEALGWLVHCLDALVGAELKSLLLENSGGKGYHVWLFLDESVNAAKVRRWVQRDFLPMWQEQAGMFEGTPLEVFPKQDDIPFGFGNLVKLPLGVHAKSGNRSTFGEVPGWATGVESVIPFPTAQIPDVAPESRPSLAATGEGKPTTAPFACIAKILVDGAPDGCRDKAMYHFARYARTQGLPEDLVLEWCERVNEGFQPPLSDQEVRTKVRSAFQANTPNPGCREPFLKGFCPGGEHCFAPWNEQRTGKVETKTTVSYLEMSPAERREARMKGNA